MKLGLGLERLGLDQAYLHNLFVRFFEPSEAKFILPSLDIGCGFPQIDMFFLFAFHEDDRHSATSQFLFIPVSRGLYT